jgi:hypothetical protein
LHTSSSEFSGYEGGSKITTKKTDKELFEQFQNDLSSDSNIDSGSEKKESKEVFMDI